MSHPVTDLHNEDKFAYPKDWMAEKQTELDLWLAEQGSSLTDVCINDGKFYIMIGGTKVDVPTDFTKHEEDYQNEE